MRAFTTEKGVEIELKPVQTSFVGLAVARVEREFRESGKRIDPPTSHSLPVHRAVHLRVVQLQQQPLQVTQLQQAALRVETLQQHQAARVHFSPRCSGRWSV